MPRRTILSDAELAVVPVDKLIPLPSDIAFADAAALLLQGLTEHYLTRDSHRLWPGEPCNELPRVVERPKSFPYRIHLNRWPEMALTKCGSSIRSFLAPKIIANLGITHS